MELVELGDRMSEAVIEIIAVDPRNPEAVELVRGLSEELAGQYEYAADGSGPAGGCFGRSQRCGMP